MGEKREIPSADVFQIIYLDIPVPRRNITSHSLNVGCRMTSLERVQCGYEG